MRVIKICAICGQEKESLRRGQTHVVHVERMVCEGCKNVHLTLNAPPTRRKNDRLFRPNNGYVSTM